jgi:hypothetical protein
LAWRDKNVSAGRNTQVIKLKPFARFSNRFPHVIRLQSTSSITGIFLSFNHIDLFNWDPFKTINELKDLFQQARAEKYKISQVFIDFKMAEESSYSSHVIKVQGYIQKLEVLGVPFDADFGTNMMLKSLLPSYDALSCTSICMG